MNFWNTVLGTVGAVLWVPGAMVFICAFIEGWGREGSDHGERLGCLGFLLLFFAYASWGVDWMITHLRIV